MADDIQESGRGDIFDTVAKRQEWLNKKNVIDRPFNAPKSSAEKPIKVGDRELTIEGGFGLIGNNTKSLLDRGINPAEPMTEDQMATILTEVNEKGQIVEKRVGEMVDEVKFVERSLKELGLTDQQIAEKKLAVFNELGIPVEKPQERKKSIFSIFAKKKP